MFGVFRGILKHAQVGVYASALFCNSAKNLLMPCEGGIRMRCGPVLMALGLGVILATGAFPAGAHQSSYSGAVPPVYNPWPADRASGVVHFSATLSPDLEVFPCGPETPEGDATKLYTTTLANDPNNPDWDSDRYDPCYGDLYTLGEGASTSSGRLHKGGGTWHGTNGVGGDDESFSWTSMSSTDLSANFTHVEPCIDRDGPVGPLGPTATTGEAIGWISIKTPTNPGSHFGDAALTSVRVKVKFWVSYTMAGAALFGFGAPVISFNDGAFAPFAIEKYVGTVVAGTFIPTAAPSCDAPTHTHPNDILISVTAKVGAGTT